MEIKKKFYSHSKLSTFEQCPLKFKYRYIDKIIPEIKKSIEAHLGTCVHSTLEWAYSEVQKSHIPSLDEIIVYFSKKWKQDYSADIIIVKENLTAKDYFNKGIEFLVNYYQKNYPFDDNTIELEKKIKIKLDSDGEYNIIGFIDRLVQNLEKNEFEVHDYKTANSLPTQEKIDNDRQLALYSIAIKEIYGEDKEVKLIWHYLAHNKKIISKRTNEQLQNLKKQTLELIKKIESTKEFPSKKTILCNWCEYKNICPVWNQENQNKIFEKNKKKFSKYPITSKYIKD